MQTDESSSVNFAKSVKAEFDPVTRILHVSYTRRIRPGNVEQLNAHFANFEVMVEKYARDGRIYLIIDMSNLIFEPEFQAEYAAHARKISEVYCLPNGIARYGYQITRITVRSSYDKYIGGNPNIFNSREEAFVYIRAQIEKAKVASLPDAAVSISPGVAADD